MPNLQTARNRHKQPRAATNSHQKPPETARKRPKTATRQNQNPPSQSKHEEIDDFLEITSHNMGPEHVPQHRPRTRPTTASLVSGAQVRANWFMRDHGEQKRVFLLCCRWGSSARSHFGSSCTFSSSPVSLKCVVSVSWQMHNLGLVWTIVKMAKSVRKPGEKVSSVRQ